MNHPYISVVMPAYNAAAFIEAAMLSVLRQPTKLELIVVNDGSSDLTSKIAHNLAADYDNCTVVDVDNGGAGRARNIGIQMAKGEVITFLDSDDLYLLDAFDENAVARVKGIFAKGADLIGTPFMIMDLSVEKVLDRRLVQRPEEMRRHMPKNAFWSFLYRREYLISNDVRFFEYSGQDIESAFRYRACSRAKTIAFIEDWRFVIQRDNPDSNTHTWVSEKLFAVKALVYSQLYDEAASDPRLKGDLLGLASVECEMLVNFFRGACDKGLTTQEGKSALALLRQNARSVLGKRPVSSDSTLVERFLFSINKKKLNYLLKREIPSNGVCIESSRNARQSEPLDVDVIMERLSGQKSRGFFL